MLLSTLLVLALGASPAYAGRAATGELLFYPCTDCHPVPPGGADGLPNDFEGHQVVLEQHAVLGAGSAACLACHDDPASDPGMLKTVDGTLVEIGSDESARVCFGCHSAIYREWEAGMHGRGESTCSAAGCHDPHTPGWISAEYLLPFTGTGFQVQVLPEMALFKPLAAPAPIPPTDTPSWLKVLTVLGVATAGGITGTLIRGRSSR